MAFTFRINYTGSSKLLKRICERINNLPGLGTEHHTAFYGDWGKAAYEHSLQQGNAHGLTLEDLGLGDILTQINALLVASRSVDRWIVSLSGAEDDFIWDDSDDELLFSFTEDALIWS